MTVVPRAADCDPVRSETPRSPRQVSSDHGASTMPGREAVPDPIEPEPSAGSPFAPPATPRPRSGLTGRDHHPRDLVPLGALWPGLAARIRIDHPYLDENALISRAEAARYRTQHIDELLCAGPGDALDFERRDTGGPVRHDILDRLKRVRYALGIARPTRGSR